MIYDRAGSSIAMASKDDFDWKAILEGAEWFHFTGITPALNDNVAGICLEACKAAKEAGIKISCDLNYRNKLWSKEKAGQVMGELCTYVDVCIANEEDATDVFGIRAENTDVYAGEVNHEGYRSVAKQLADRLGVFLFWVKPPRECKAAGGGARCKKQTSPPGDGRLK